MLPPKLPHAIEWGLRGKLEIVKVPDNQSLLRCIDRSLSEPDLRVIDQFLNLAWDITKFPNYAETLVDQGEMGAYSGVVDDYDRGAASYEGVRRRPYLTLEEDEVPSKPYSAAEKNYIRGARLLEGIPLAPNETPSQEEQGFGKLHMLPHLKSFGYSGEDRLFQEPAVQMDAANMEVTRGRHHQFRST
ncbi:hypothetical protein BDZ94DRAFT_1310223 [Collybia nuda]|uniref:Uncharacterized protein n=1 Tax=Collybia nuda TaxID=64659 RepID=A0A9P6CDL6_9AGAR|nr:hypothetical protein BDZ94DRAFT_1310223 [Collybia nuda]